MDQSIAIGGKEFVDKVKLKLGVLAQGREVRETDTGYELRETGDSYMHHFEAEKCDRGCENGYFWDVTININEIAWPDPGARTIAVLLFKEVPLCSPLFCDCWFDWTLS